MNRGWRLLGNLVAWLCALPAIFVAASALESHGPVVGLNMLPPIAAVILLIWAGVIYWSFIKNKTRSRFLEACCFLGFFVLMAAGGAVSLWLTYWLMLAIHGA